MVYGGTQKEQASLSHRSGLPILASLAFCSESETRNTGPCDKKETNKRLTCESNLAITLFTNSSFQANSSGAILSSIQYLMSCSISSSASACTPSSISSLPIPSLLPSSSPTSASRCILSSRLIWEEFRARGGGGETAEREREGPA